MAEHWALSVDAAALFDAREEAVAAVAPLPLHEQHPAQHDSTQGSLTLVCCLQDLGVGALTHLLLQPVKQRFELGRGAAPA